MIQCKTCGVPQYCLEYLPEEGQWYCPLCESRTPVPGRIGYDRRAVAAAGGPGERLSVDEQPRRR